MRKILFLLIFAWNFSALAEKTLVISDIDDTLKVTHVRSAVDWLHESLETDWAFPGMNFLLQNLAQDPETEFIYVSNAPERLMRARHGKFLQRHQFPPGTLYLSPTFFQKGDKIPVLRRILQSTSATTVIFFGDNGEKDPLTYDQIAREFPALVFRTFIRKNYVAAKATPLQSDQIGFVTPAEVALELTGTSLSGEQTAQIILATDVKDPQLGLPGWVRCTGHRPLLLLLPDLVDETLALEKRIHQRCR